MVFDLIQLQAFEFMRKCKLCVSVSYA